METTAERKLRNLRRLMREKKFRQRHLALKAKVGESTLNRILKGRRGLGDDVMARLAQALEVDQAEFLRPEDITVHPVTQVRKGDPPAWGAESEEDRLRDQLATSELFHLIGGLSLEQKDVLLAMAKDMTLANDHRSVAVGARPRSKA